jgi:RNA polymerase subunit RPABC4/transcription elongation factor Spt4
MDERELIEFETPYVLAEVFPSRILAPEDQRKCSQCGVESRPLPASELTVIKHRHSSQPLGHMRIYCHEHLAGAKEWTESAGGETSRRTGPVCPNCFMTVPTGTGVCETCGETVG